MDTASKISGIWGVLHDKNTSWDLCGTECTLGRNPQCYMTVSNPHISGTHCVIRNSSSTDSKSAFTIEDRSTNGTWMNDLRLPKGQPKPLPDGSVIYGLKESFRFQFSVVNSKCSAEKSGAVNEEDRRHKNSDKCENTSESSPTESGESVSRLGDTAVQNTIQSTAIASLSPSGSPSNYIATTEQFPEISPSLLTTNNEKTHTDHRPLSPSLNNDDLDPLKAFDPFDFSDFSSNDVAENKTDGSLDSNLVESINLSQVDLKSCQIEQDDIFAALGLDVGIDDSDDVSKNDSGNNSPAHKPMCDSGAIDVMECKNPPESHDSPTNSPEREPSCGDERDIIGSTDCTDLSVPPAKSEVRDTAAPISSFDLFPFSYLSDPSESDEEGSNEVLNSNEVSDSNEVPDSNEVLNSNEVSDSNEVPDSNEVSDSQVMEPSSAMDEETLGGKQNSVVSSEVFHDEVTANNSSEIHSVNSAKKATVDDIECFLSEEARKLEVQTDDSVGVPGNLTIKREIETENDSLKSDSDFEMSDQNDEEFGKDLSVSHKRKRPSHSRSPIDRKKAKVNPTSNKENETTQHPETPAKPNNFKRIFQNVRAIFFAPQISLRRDLIARLLKKHGGSVVSELDELVTHFICSKSTERKKVFKDLGITSVPQNVTVVTFEWVSASIRGSKIMPNIKDFAVKSFEAVEAQKDSKKGVKSLFPSLDNLPRPTSSSLFRKQSDNSSIQDSQDFMPESKKYGASLSQSGSLDPYFFSQDRM
eukprot:864749_1